MFGLTPLEQLMWLVILSLIWRNLDRDHRGDGVLFAIWAMFVSWHYRFACWEYCFVSPVPDPPPPTLSGLQAYGAYIDYLWNTIDGGGE